MVDPTNLLSTPQGYASPQQIAHMQEVARALSEKNRQDPILHWTQGAANMVGALMGGLVNNRALQMQREAREGQAAAIEKAFQPGGGPDTSGGVSPRLSDASDTSPAAPSATASASPSGSLSGVPTDRIAAAKQFFTSQGYTEPQVAGIIGNLIQESNLDPKLTHDGGIGLGIAGWNGPRLAALRQFAAQRGTDATDYNTQLAFVDHELKSSEGTAMRALQAADTPGAAASAFIGFERPQGWTRTGPVENSSGYGRRVALANTLGGAPSAAPAPASAPAPTSEPQQVAQVLSQPQGRGINLSPSDQITSMAQTIAALVRTGAMDPSEAAKLMMQMRTQMMPQYSVDEYGREVVTVPGREPQYTGRQRTPGKAGEFSGFKTYETLGPDGQPNIRIVPPTGGAPTGGGAPVAAPGVPSVGAGSPVSPPVGASSASGSPPAVAGANPMNAPGIPPMPGPNASPQDWMAWQQQLEASKAATKKGAEEGAAKLSEVFAKPVGEAVEEGAKAQVSINILDRMADAYMNAGPGGINGGPLAKGLMGMRQGLQQVFGGDWNVAPKEVVNKANAELSAAIIKGMSSRGGTQMEFAAMMQNNPGILMSDKGALYMINILKQQEQQKQQLAVEASKIRDPREFSAVQQAFYKTHPLISPFTGKPLQGADLKADVDQLLTYGNQTNVPPPGEAPAAGAAPEPGHIKYLQGHPDEATISQFNAKYGAGAAEKILNKPSVPQSR